MADLTLLTHGACVCGYVNARLRLTAEPIELKLPVSMVTAPCISDCWALVRACAAANIFSFCGVVWSFYLFNGEWRCLCNSPFCLCDVWPCLKGPTWELVAFPIGILMRQMSKV